jgi:membrane-bound metal-dependent hydrolase YbcI (DUF457 family)
MRERIISEIDKTLRSEDGFMGMTHALSAVALLSVVLAFKEQWITSVAGNASTPYLILLFLVVVGGALMPDLDNTKSSAKSALGFIGSGISWFMRKTAPIIQGLLHTRYDKDTENAHRGFYHTALSAVLFGLLGMFLCSNTIDIPITSSFHINGLLFAIILAFIGVHIALSTLGKPILKPLKSSAGILGFIIPTVLSAVVIGVLTFQLPTSTDYSKIGLAFGVGWMIHIIGDMFTTQGVPVLFPIPIKGHLWWHVRLLPIKAGGVIENFVFIPFFIIVILISIWVVVM